MLYLSQGSDSGGCVLASQLGYHAEATWPSKVELLFDEPAVEVDVGEGGAEALSVTVAPGLFHAVELTAVLEVLWCVAADRGFRYCGTQTADAWPKHETVASAAVTAPPKERQVLVMTIRARGELESRKLES